MSSEFTVAFDIEGPLINPGYDFAWLSLEELIKVDDDLHKRIETFDEYDDLRWLAERETRGHSTGTTPLISLCQAASMGINDNELFKLAEKAIIENKGVDKLLKFLINNGVMPYLITSSYPATALIEGKKYNIPSNHLFTAGHQLSEIKSQDMMEEVRERSPITNLSGSNDKLKQFIGQYLDNCHKMRDAYLNKNQTLIEELKKEQEKVFQNVPEEKLRNELIYLLYQENGIMGAHNKAKVLGEVAQGKTIFVGDSIVDADPLELADFGIAVNCTNADALKACDINVCLYDFGNLVSIMSGIMEGKSVEDMKKFSTDELKIFSPSDIKNNFDMVKSTNKTFKSKLKEEYKRAVG